MLSNYRKPNLAVLVNISMDESNEVTSLLSEHCSCKSQFGCVVLNFFRELRLNASEVEGIIARSKDTSDSESDLCDMFTLLEGLELRGGAPTRKPPTTWQEVDARMPYNVSLAAHSLLDEVTFSRCFRVSVEGYNILHHIDRVKDELGTHFFGCGEICDVVIPFNRRTGRISDRCSVIYFWEESAVEKALELSGTDVGGWNVIVKPLPKKVCELSTDQVAAALKDLHFKDSRLHSFHVTLPDTRIPEEDVKSALFKLFSPCGEITALDVRKACGACHVCMWGDGALEKAKALNGSDLGGWKADVWTPEPLNFEKKEDKFVSTVDWTGPPLHILESLQPWDGIYKPADPRKLGKRKKAAQ